ncbi:zf-DHHC-domain-containing protein [Hesseltinella vesiculosa]|uniref:Palmitoyltransferase n=1 Tax=Hesseltinella vesiculosa TaxID=101127 RepID=A0A1X2GZ67_9FUNG|nr:zf-DHHC-domain-containing protein [Hesseltinella vesiculosa]
MALISYVRIITTSPGYPDQLTQLGQLESSLGSSSTANQLPQYCYLPAFYNKKTMNQDSSLIDSIQRPFLPALTVTDAAGMPRYCELCRCLKPSRTHHCSDCDKCVLKMDHHCPWVSNCVGHHNYKFFFLFVTYTGLYGLWGLCSALPLVVRALADGALDLDPQWIVLLVFAFIFGLTVCGFSVAHLTYILQNRTTIEQLSTRPEHIRVDLDPSGHTFEVIMADLHERLWDMGWLANWQSVMGHQPWAWFIPIHPVIGDGTLYPFNETSYHRIVEKAKAEHATHSI